MGEFGDRRRRLMALMLEREGLTTDAAPTEPEPDPETPNAGTEVLSPAEERLWMLHQRDPLGAAGAFTAALRLTGPLDAARLLRALRALAERHPALRTVYRFDGEGELRPHLLDPDAVEVRLVEADGPDLEDAARSLARRWAREPFDLAEHAPLRARVVRGGERDAVLVLTAHHIAVDDASWPTIFRDLSAHYAAAGGAAAAPADYRAYAAVRARVVGERSPGQLGYWRERFPEPPRPLPLPTAWAPLTATETADTAGTSTVDVHRHRITVPDGEGLRELARRLGASPFHVLTAGFCLLVRAATGARRCTVATPVVDPEVMREATMVGATGNTVLLALGLDDGDTFAGLVGRVRAEAAGALAHADVPLERVLGAVGAAGARPYNLMVLQRQDLVSELSLPGVEVAELALQPIATDADLTFAVAVTGDSLVCDLTHPATITPAVGRLLLEDALRLLRRAGTHPDDDLATLLRGADLALARNTSAPVLDPATEPAEPTARAEESTADPETVQAIVDVFAEVLGGVPVRPGDDFFALGGHSLLATRAIGRLTARHGLNLRIRDFFDAPTALALAARCAAPATRERPAVRSPQPEPETPYRVPLSQAQRGLWFRMSLEDSSAAFTIPFALRVAGELDPSTLSAALEDVLARHDALRSRVVAADPEPMLEVTAPAAPPVAEHSASEAELDGLIAALVAEPLPLDREVLRCALVHLTDSGDRVLLLLVHHLVCDEESVGPLGRDLAEAYRSRSRGQRPPWDPPPIRAADAALLVDKRAADARPALDYWRDRLAGAPEELVLPTDRPRPARPSARGAALRFTLDRDVRAGIKRLARRHGATEFMVVHAATAALLSRLGAGEDVVLGSPVSLREDEEMAGLVGFFVNSVVLRTDLTGDPTFAELLARVRETDLGAFEHQRAPFERVVEAVNPPRSAARHPLYQVMIAYQHAEGSGIGEGGRFAGLAAEPVFPTMANVRFDLELKLAEYADAQDVEGVCWYSVELFDEATVLALLERLRAVLTQVAADPDVRVGSLRVLLPGEEGGMRGPAPVTAPDAFPLDLIARTAERFPDRPAVDQRTYRELLADAHRLARYLVERGAGPETHVGIAVDRDADLVVAMLAAWAAGAAYLPLDLDLPDERLRLMVEDTPVTLTLVAPGSAERLAGITGTPVCEPATDESWSATPLTDADRRAPRDLRHPAYTIHTSGSTGRPKGVVITARSLTGFLTGAVARLGLTERDRVPALATTAFDVSVLEIFATLLAGGTVAVVPRSVVRDPRALVATLRELAPTLVQATPSLWQMIAERLATSGDADPLGDATVLTGAEPLPLPLLPTLHGGARRRVLNLFGPTETTVWAAMAEVEPGRTRPPSAGGPLPGVVFHVLDARLRPVPPGVAGELYIGGPGLARGYASAPGRTAERFVADPFGAPGARLYRTGDLVRYRRDGELEFLGRVDFQLKVRGFRIEPGEIESVLTRVPGVRRALVTGVESSGRTRLVAHLECDPDAVDAAAARAFVADALPEYMVPSELVAHRAFPLTPTGKVDRAALPAPDRPEDSTRAPMTDRERALAQVFADCLDRAPVGADDDFFALGGHSLMAAQLVARAGALFGVDLGVRDLFDAPSVAALGARIEELLSQGAATARRPSRPEPAPRAEGTEIELSPAQRRLWFLDQLGGPSPVYNIPLALRIDGPLDVDVLRAALADVVGRHEALRTLVGEENGRPRPVILTAAQARPLIQVTEHGAGTVDDEERVRQAARRPFDLATDLPVRADVFSASPDRHLLLLLQHHLVSDEASFPPFLRDLAVAYRSRLTKNEPDWAPLPVQFADAVLADLRAQREDPGFGGSLAYWRGELAGLPEETPLPTDRPRPARPTGEGGLVEFALPAETAMTLRALAAQVGATEFMVVHTAVVGLLNRLGAGTDIAIGTPVTGRWDESLAELVGFFVNTLVLRADASGDPSFRELLRRVRDRDLSAFEHQRVPFDRVVEEANPVRSPARHPLFQVMVAYHYRDASLTPLPDTTVEPVICDPGVAKFDLDLNVGADPDGSLAGTLEYSADLFDRATARELSQRLTALLTQVAAQPDLALSELDILLPGEAAPLREGGLRRVDVPELSVADLFDAQARRTPTAPALSDRDTGMDFAELAARSHGLARMLVARGIGPESVVGLALPRDAELVVALFAVLTAGAAYLPLEPDLPAGRVEAMLADASPGLVLTKGRPPWPPPTDTAVLDLDDPTVRAEWDAADGAELTDADRTAPRRPEHPAYVIFTSGSTGRPKGVVVPYGGLTNMAVNHDREVFAPTLERAGGRTLRIAHTTAFSFDASWEQLLWLIAGHHVVIVDERTRRDPDALLELFDRERIDAFDVTPTYGLRLLEWGLLDEGRHRPVLMSLGGEAVPDALWQRLREAPHTWGYNLYGPTEYTINALGASVDDSDTPVVGIPVTNTRALVLDARLCPVPDGVIGELYLSGAGVARGYVGRPALTAERFVATGAGERMYRTGDLVRRRRDGLLEYLGRADDQVKLRGFRIEPAEIESVLLESEHVAQAAVVLSADADRLLGYLVAPTGGAPNDTADDTAVRALLARRLPAHMVPSTLSWVDELPLTVNGKLDRAALRAREPEAGPARPADRARLPDDPAAREVALVFAELLGLDVVGADDGFFDLGGHSLLAVELVAKLRARGATLGIPEVMVGPTPRELAGHLGHIADKPRNTPKDIGGGLSPMLALRSKGERTPLVCVHPALGFGWPFAGLARGLAADQPLYALQSPLLSDPHWHPASLREVAEEYLDRVRRVLGNRPVHLLGWSFGGVVAHAMTAIAHERGEPTGLLAVMDGYPPLSGTPDDSHDPVSAPGPSLFTDRPPEDADAEVAALLGGLDRDDSLLGPELRTAAVAGYRTVHRLLAAPWDGTVRGDMLFFTATTGGLVTGAHKLWEPQVDGVIWNTDIDCGHYQMADEKPLATIAASLAPALAGYEAGVTP
ncbi:non-ribosomal peptide synthetase [Pseudonocardia acaciae]|uniref:non-ribosomal peptide synthetase n=1 Tax=Pseudonocardia acaciae TaxID=551276 RepID=UPI000686BC14|nr:non-ribosomal peptide synthetase [Pseudonocardia acaciae]